MGYRAPCIFEDVAQCQNSSDFTANELQYFTPEFEKNFPKDPSAGRLDICSLFHSSCLQKRLTPNQLIEMSSSGLGMTRRFRQYTWFDRFIDNRLSRACADVEILVDLVFFVCHWKSGRVDILDLSVLCHVITAGLCPWWSHTQLWTTATTPIDLRHTCKCRHGHKNCRR